MADPIPYDATSDALLRPAEGAVFFQGWREEDTANHDLLCAEMSRLAYAPADVVRGEAARVGFATTPLVAREGEERDFLGTQGFVARASGGPTILAFRGTESDQIDDLIVDGRVVQTEGRGRPGCLVHSGFARCWDAVKARVAGLLEPREGEVLITGHSLGAALATLAALELQPAELITFGSPRVGDAGFRNLFRGIRVRRFVNCCDLIARLPPERFQRVEWQQIFTEVAGLEGADSFAARLKSASIRAAAGALDLTLRSLGVSPSFAHVAPELYGDAGGTIRVGFGADERIRDQAAARRAYAPRAGMGTGPAEGARFDDLLSIASAKSANEAIAVLQRFFAPLLRPIGSTVPLRDLADHAPINYVSLFTGRR